MRTETIETAVHGTYHLVEPEGEPSALLVGFHGYGETALDHLEAMRGMAGAVGEAGRGWALCSVQGLHPFYRRNGDVVASWMTKFDRENAIADNSRYAGAVVERLLARYPSVRKLAYTGFSQGVAMAYRAAGHSGRPGHALVALAGDVPPDVAETGLADFPPVLIGRGDQEQWYSEAKLASDREVLGEAGVEVEVAHFTGGHEWTGDFLRTAGDFLARHLKEG